MKKQKTKSLIKTARKNIKLSLITELTAVAAKLAPLSKGIEKEIRKDAKSLAKKIAKKLPAEGVLVTVETEAVPAKAVKPAAKVVADTTVKAKATKVKA